MGEKRTNDSMSIVIRTLQILAGLTGIVAMLDNNVVDAFTTTTINNNIGRSSYRLDSRRRRRVSFPLLLHSNNDNNNNDTTSTSESSSPSLSTSAMMSGTSFLSHVMLRVPSVDESVSYWTEIQGGKVTISKGNGMANGEEELLSAFVELGRSTTSKNTANNDNEEEAMNPPVFSLELVKTKKENYSVGNIISYVGISMLLQFKDNLLGAITNKGGTNENNDSIGIGQEQENGIEPNGIPVKSVASAPGDYIAQLTLKSKNLTSTCDFYTNVLGMENKAQDDKLLCLRYNDNDTKSSSSGVPTTLVFENVAISSDDDNNEHHTIVLEKGDCFDHIAIQTTIKNVDKLYEEVVAYQQEQKQKQNNTAGNNDLYYNMYMKPTTMFGMKVIGFIDPNGYKVVIAGR
mmetsp:Transcript_1128/g.1289  ORF Transcript_1128/g.1289 Transcript_1128/m.1289 type:complete len:403 (+) Transcript_1128:144-1352(+)